MRSLATHGRTFVGVVISDKMRNTVTVQWPRRKFIQKYERYTKAKTKVKAHNPDEINAKTGQIVEIMETRPISKTKKFIITKILGEDEDTAIAIKEKEAEKEEKAKAKKELEKEKKVEEEIKEKNEEVAEVENESD